VSSVNLTNARGRLRAGTTFVLAVVLLGIRVPAQESWFLTDLGTVGAGRADYATSINNVGQIVGYGFGQQNQTRSFLWSSGLGMINIGHGEARGINNLGQVVGIGGNFHAFLWTLDEGISDHALSKHSPYSPLSIGWTNEPTGRNIGSIVNFDSLDSLPYEINAHGRMIDLGSLGQGVYDMSKAYGINDLGQVVGTSQISENEEHAFVWTATEGMVDIGTLGGPAAVANAINNAGQVVGASYTVGGYHAFLWTAASGMVDLGHLGGNYSEAFGINDVGQVVGFSVVDPGAVTHAFLWTPTSGMIDLGTLGGNYSVAHAINDAGQVVGSSNTTNGGLPHAFLWTAATGMVDLGTLNGGSYSAAYDINDVGQIVGDSFIAEAEPGFYRRAVLWSKDFVLLGLEPSGVPAKLPLLKNHSTPRTIPRAVPHH
jgi:probable HAF family extracellular repeat protein